MGAIGRLVWDVLADRGKWICIAVNEAEQVNLS